MFMNKKRGHSVVGVLFLIIFSLSIFLKPVHFVVIKHVYYGRSHNKTELVVYHKDCPLEKEEVIQSSPPNILSIDIAELSEYKPFVFNYFFKPISFWGNILLRSPPSL